MQRPFWECWPHIQHYALIEMDGFIGLAIGYHSYAQYISHYTCIITRNLVMTVCICEQITFEHTQRMYHIKTAPTLQLLHRGIQHFQTNS